MRFDSYDHVAAYAKDGSFPAIHDDIFMLIQRADTGDVPERGPHRTYLDLGCCYGLLTARIATQLPYARAVGIDSNPHYIRKAIAYYPEKPGYGVQPIERVEYQQFRLDGSEQSLSNFQYLLREKHVDFVVARRVLPEIWESALTICKPSDQSRAMDYMQKLTDILWLQRVGVFLEGRKPTPKATNLLCSIEKETELFMLPSPVHPRDAWIVKDTLGNCRYLVPNLMP